jgi:hypothetical protein
MIPPRLGHASGREEVKHTAMHLASRKGDFQELQGCKTWPDNCRFHCLEVMGELSRPLSGLQILPCEIGRVQESLRRRKPTQETWNIQRSRERRVNEQVHLGRRDLRHDHASIFCYRRYALYTWKERPDNCKIINSDSIGHSMFSGECYKRRALWQLEGNRQVIQKKERLSERL